jgi:hypothetical protein
VPDRRHQHVNMKQKPTALLQRNVAALRTHPNHGLRAENVRQRTPFELPSNEALFTERLLNEK